jgi:hypothetical protein
MQQPARQVERINIFQRKLDSKKLTKLPDTHRPVRDLRMSIPCDFQCYYICSYILAIYLFGGGFPGGSVVKSPPAKQKTWVQFLSREDPLAKKMAISTLQYSCLGNPIDRGAWRATKGCKEQDTT